MYTSTMTADELVKEFTADLPQIIGVSDAKQKKADRIIKKSVLFPVYLHSFVRSKRGNDWMILIEAKSKKYIGDNSLITLVSTFDVGHGHYAIMWSAVRGQPQYIIFTPHFFQRFALRAGVNLTGIELIHRYFKMNPAYGFNIEKEVTGDMEKTNVYGSANEGAALGVRLYTEHNIILFRTFITYDMCKGEQIENFAKADQFRREMHEEETTI